MADSSRLDQVSFLSCHRLLYAFRFAPAGMATTSAIFFWRHNHAQPAASRPPSTRRAAADKGRRPAVRCVVRWHRATGCPLCGQPSTEAATGWQPEPAATSAIADAAGSRCDDGRCICSRPGSRQPDAAGLRRAIVKRPRVLIVGAGFAGFHCARQLERKLEAHEAEVALVTSRNYLIYSPLLPQVAAGLLSPMAVAIPLRRTIHRTHLVPGAA